MSRWVFRHRRSVVVGLFLGAVVGAYLGYQRLVAAQDSGPVRYVTQAVARETLITSVSGTGNMTLATTYSITSPVSGTVEKVSVKVGDTVKKGQRLFVVSADEINDQIESAYLTYKQAQASALNAKAGRLQAQQKLDQLEEQEADGMDISDTEFAVAEDQLEAAKISYASALRQRDSALAEYEEDQGLLWKRDVTAAGAGVVTTLSIAVGDSVTGTSAASSGGSSSSGASSGSSSDAGSDSSATSESGNGSSGGTGAALVLSDVASQRAVVTLNETDVPSVEVGQKATLTFDAITDLTLTGKVERLGTTGTVSSGVVTYEVTIKPDTLDERVRPGMTVSAAIITHVAADVLTVPSAAVRSQSDGASYVQVLVNGTPQTKTVQTGSTSESAVEVSSGLSAGDKVVTQTIEPGKSTSTTTPRGANGGLDILTGGGDRGAFGGGGPPSGGPPPGMGGGQ